MTDRVQKAMQEVWEWKRQAEDVTREMAPADLIEFYRRQAQDVERRLGLHLKSGNADDVVRTRP